MHLDFKADPLTFNAQAAKLFGIRDGLRLLGTPHRLARDLPMLILIGEEIRSADRRVSGCSPTRTARAGGWRT